MSPPSIEKLLAMGSHEPAIVALQFSARLLAS